ncbi:MAG: hypothetical protein K8J09_23070 [Planctomycetes bacterium]|nr:hypothetical protein [Planctomycetota bacterium]MCC7396570.1 hypothetical protein [Planctomycetota bacterium]
MRSTPVALFALLLTTACASVPYDLAEVPFPVMASPGKDAGGEPFAVRGHYTMWVHGLFGESKPDIAAELTKSCNPCAAVTDFRVTVSAGFHEWLVTHLTLGFVRMKTVTISGRKQTLTAAR